MSTNNQHAKKLKHTVGGIEDEIQELEAGINDRFQRSFSYPTTRSDNAGSSRQNNLDLRANIEFPRFAGGDPTEWFNRAEQFFDLQRTPEDQKLSLASFHMEGEADQWWQFVEGIYKEENQTVTWEKFAEELWARFGPTYGQELTRIKQRGSLQDYLRDFETLGNIVRGWRQRELVEIFVGGLKAEIANFVRLLEPRSLKDAISMARRRDEQLRRLQRQITTPSPDSTKVTYNYQPTDLEIYKAALHDKWDSVSAIFDQYPELMTKTISARLETPLMIAVGTKSNNFVKKLHESLSRRDILNSWMDAQNIEGNHVLHYAAKVGNLKAAEILLDNYMYLNMTECHRNYEGNTPLILAASVGEMDILQYLISKTVEHLICNCGLASFYIQAGLLDKASHTLDKCQNINNECLNSQGRALEVLATKVELFPSGRKLGFFGYLLYSLVPLFNFPYDTEELRTKNGIEVKRLSKIVNRFWEVIGDYAPIVKHINGMKQNHILSSVLVKHLCKSIIERADHDMAWMVLGSAIAKSIKYGNYEFIEECILEYPSIIWYNFDGSCFFHYAIRQRQEKVHNLIYQMSDYKTFVKSQLDDDRQENLLHIAAKLAPPHRLNIMTGAALQMQRELLWFKEVEKLVEPSYKEALNIEKKTPRMVFTDEHKGLLIDGQQWMKDTSASCTVVAALIITMTFAAAFQIPGGNKDDGKPVFLEQGAFMVFVISNAIAFISSSTSVLMFLGILTSRYAEEDFLKALPKRLTIGLVSLFLSLAATLVTFGATLALMLQEKVSWIAAPIVIVASIPVCLFVLLQFPLLVELVYSTYGESIFHKQNERMIH